MERSPNQTSQFQRDFIIKHATSLAAYYALYQKINNNLFILDEINDLHYFKVVASSLSALYPESQYTKAIMNHLKQIGQAIRNQQLAEAINNSEKSLPDIKLPDAKGDSLSLLPIKSKFVVLEFGVLTAQQSQTYINDLKKVYQKFKNRGVEIYQVCLDKNKFLWEDLVKKNNITWKCVRDEYRVTKSGCRNMERQNNTGQLYYRSKYGNRRKKSMGKPIGGPTE